MKTSLVTKLYDYWLDRHILRPYKVVDLIGYNVVNFCMGWHFNYVMGHKQLHTEVQTYKGAWETSKLNHKNTLSELHRYIAKYGELV